MAKIKIEVTVRPCLIRQPTELKECSGCKETIYTDQYMLIMKATTSQGKQIKELGAIFCQPCAERTMLNIVE